MTRSSLIISVNCCAFMLMLISAAIIAETYISPEPTIVDTSALGADPAKFSDREIEVRGLWCNYVYPLYYCKGPEPECPLRTLSETEKERFARNSHCDTVVNCPGMPLLTPDGRKYDSCVQRSPPRLVIILKQLIYDERMIGLIDPGCATRSPHCLVDIVISVVFGGYDVRAGSPTIVAVSSGRVIPR
jgi:hypothetical protein